MTLTNTNFYAVLGVDHLVEFYKLGYWYDFLVASHVLAHLFSALNLFVLLLAGILYVKRRPSMPVDNFIKIYGIFFLLLAFSQLSDLFYIWWVGPAVNAILNLFTIGFAAYLMLLLPDYFDVARKYYTPEDTIDLRGRLYDAEGIGRLNRISAVSLTRDIEKLCNTLSEEYNARDNDERVKIIMEYLTEYAELGYGSFSKKLNLEECFNKAKLELADEIEAKNLEILTEEFPVLDVYPDMITRLFKELISNVIKHNREKEPNLLVFMEELEFEWLFTFEDNGNGLILRLQGDLFNIFRFDEDERADLSKGHGLAFARKVIRTHHGHIWMQSDHTTTMSIMFTIPKNLNLSPDTEDLERQELF